MNRLRQRLQGLGVTILLLLLVIGFPTALIAIGAAPWDADLGKLRILLTSPDDGTLALVVFAVVAWVAWAVMAVSVVVEAVAQLRGLSAPSIPGLALPQRAAGQLVAVAALLFVAAPVVVSGFPAPPAHAAAAPPVLAAPRLEAVAEAAPVLAEGLAPVPTAATVRREQATVNYTVKRGDSLWKIAERLLGDGARYKEIVELNQEVLNGRPDFIVSGAVLKVPHEGAPRDEEERTTEEYLVRPGDTLSEIAEDKLGDPMRYPEIFAASRSTVQPDGAHLTDPDLIRPGWKLTIPGTTPVEHDPVEPPDDVEPPLDVGPPDEPPVDQPTTEPTAEPTPSVDSTATATADHADDAEEESTPGWLMPGLTGAGAVLAGAVLLAVRAHRRTQLRYRRPGQTIAPPPPELIRAEKTAFVSGAPLTDGIEQLDRVLRHLAATVEAEGRALPVLAGLTLARGRVTLHLGEAADLPFPWEGEGSEWATLLGDSVPDSDEIPPYPMLVTVGQDNAGRLHLLNLENLRALTLTGEPVAATALARHIAAELALNPWSLLVEVDAVGVGEELAALDSMRLRHHAPDSTVVERIVTELRKAEQPGFGEPDPFRVVITTSVHDATRLTNIVRSASSRLGAAVVAMDTSPVPGSAAVELTKDGRLRVADLGLDLVAAGLTSDEAAACAAIVDLTRESPAVSMPTFTQAADGWRSLTDQAGALSEELTDAREDGPVGDGSLLPNPAEKYTEVAATITADVEALAPVVPDQVRRDVEDADPMLDDDVAAWFSEECPFPRLTLLGPVTARAHGTIVPAITKRKPYFVELLAFLALHPEGKTGNAVADAFSIGSSRARTDLGHLREWLGTNPRTGRLHLPAAAASRTYEQTGVKTYQVEDVLADVDLFRRLRARGEARGAEGIDDLTTALRLVEGPPFDYLRERGWSWLLDGDRLNETIGCSIVDTAHIVVLDALVKGDLATARNAADTACRAAPYDDICRLDLVKVAVAEGHDDVADQILTDDVFNRTDDHLPPIDLPERTDLVVGKQGWGSARRSGSH
jgi:nucleoid-associated protein YgaU